MSIILAKNFVAEKLQFDSVKKNALGGKVVYLNYENSKKITMQTPELSTPFGLGSYTDDSTGITKYSLDASFRGMEQDAKVKSFHDAMKNLDNYLIDVAVKNSKDWFGKKMSREVVEELYRPLVKPSKEPEKYAPTIKFKIISNDSGMKVLAFDQNKEPFDMNNMTPGGQVACIIEVGSVWFVNKQFGVSWRLVQAKINQQEQLTGCAFVDSDSDDELEETDDPDETF